MPLLLPSHLVQWRQRPLLLPPSHTSSSGVLLSVGMGPAATTTAAAMVGGTAPATHARQRAARALSPRKQTTAKRALALPLDAHTRHLATPFTTALLPNGVTMACIYTGIYF